MRVLIVIVATAGAAALAYALWQQLGDDEALDVDAPPSDYQGIFSSLLNTASTAATDVGDYVTTLISGPRGIRNNNPGNIRLGNDWQGEVAQPTDKAFEQFVSPEYGIRALAKVLLKYQSAYGLATVRAIISRWAPPNENNTNAYVAAVAKAMGVSADKAVTLKSDPATLQAMIVAIIKHENGQQPYTPEQIRAGVALA